MRQLTVIAVLALLLPVTVFAKGASEATIDGPGLDGGLEISGTMALETLAHQAGFYPSVFETTPSPMLDTQPGIDLGPRFTVRWVMPYPEGSSAVVQDLYPYARPFPVSYTRPGQEFFGGMRTLGGWYQGTPELKQTLTALGLPATRPGTDRGGGMDGRQIAVLALGGAAALVFAARKALTRRSPAPA